MAPTLRAPAAAAPIFGEGRDRRHVAHRSIEEASPNATGGHV